MRKIGTLTLALVAVVALPRIASAKEVTALRVCGAAACRDVSDPAQLRVWLEGGFSDTAEAAVGRYYRVAMGWGEGGKTLRTKHTVWLPSPGLIRAWGGWAGRWWRLSDPQNALLREAAEGLEPAGLIMGGRPRPTATNSAAGHAYVYAGLGAAALAGLAVAAAALALAVRRRGRRTPITKAGA